MANSTVVFPPPLNPCQAEIQAIEQALTIGEIIGESSWRQITRQFVWILVSQGIVVALCLLLHKPYLLLERRSRRGDTFLRKPAGLKGAMHSGHRGREGGDADDEEEDDWDLSSLYDIGKWWRDPGRSIRKFLEHYVGTEEVPPDDKKLIHVLCTVDIVCSFLTIVFWIVKSYTKKLDPPIVRLELVFAAFFFVTYWVNLIRARLNPLAPFSARSLVTIITAVPLVLQSTPLVTWMNVSFVRALAMLWAYEDLEGTGALDNAGDVRRRFIVFVMRFVALVICFAGTMYVFEVLGDHYWVQDAFTEAEMGPVSFYQMCYFIVITISTVGYGDFAPKTLLGRAFVVVVIISGVAFFSIETAELLRLGRAEASGLGSLKRRGRGRQAGLVLVCGGAVSAGSSTLADFLEEVCRRPLGATPPPQVVLLSSREPDPALRALIRKKWAQRHVTLLLGSVLDQRDLARARAEGATMAFVLANLTAADVDAEDEETVLAAAALKRAVPSLPVRVLLARQASRKMAAAAGLPPHACLAASEVAPRLLALGVRCPGAVALFINAIRSTPLSVPKGAEQPWHREYIHGASQQLHGAALGPPTHAELAAGGRTFGALAHRLKQDWDVAVVGVQKQGVVALNPAASAELSEGDVVFALASDEATLRRACRSPPGDGWKTTFHRKRDDADLRAARALLAARRRGDSAAAAAHGAAVAAHALAASPPGSPLSRAGSSGSGRGGEGLGRWFRHRRWLAAGPGSDPDLLSSADEAADEAAAEAAARAGGHLLVITPGGGDWAQVRELLVALRCRAFPLPMPVVLFSPEAAPRALLRLGASIHALRGELKDTAALLRAGLASAACTLYSAGDPAPTANPEMIDRRAVLAARILERAAAAAGRDAAVVSEMHTPDSLRYLPETALEAEPWATAAASLAARKFRCALGPLAARLLGAGAAAGEPSAPAPAPPAVADAQHAHAHHAAHRAADPHRRQLTQQEQERHAAEQLAALATLAIAHPSPYLHARYAAGRAAFRTDASRLFGHVFFTPGVFELFAALVDPYADEQQQGSLLWLVRLPDGLAGKPYAELCDHLLGQGVLALGLFRQSPANKGGGRGAGAAVPAPGEPAAARAGGGRSGTLPFVFTNPPGWLPLRRSDGVYVLAPPEWAASHVPEYAALRFEDAAASIQAAWRGYKARQRVRALRAAQAAAAAHQPRLGMPNLNLLSL